MSTQNVSDLVHPIRFVERRKLLQTAAAVAAAGVLPVAAASAPKKITVVTGSLHRRGASFLLTDEFIRGAKEVGAEIYRFDAAIRRVTACSGCDHCGLGSSPCVYRDDMFELSPHLIDCDLVVLSTPLYYFGFSAQLTASTPSIANFTVLARPSCLPRPGTTTIGRIPLWSPITKP